MSIPQGENTPAAGESVLVPRELTPIMRLRLRKMIGKGGPADIDDAWAHILEGAPALEAAEARIAALTVERDDHYKGLLSERSRRKRHAALIAALEAENGAWREARKAVDAQLALAGRLLVKQSLTPDERCFDALAVVNSARSALRQALKSSDG